MFERDLRPRLAFDDTVREQINPTVGVTGNPLSVPDDGELCAQLVNAVPHDAAVAGVTGIARRHSESLLAWAAQLAENADTAALLVARRSGADT